MKDLFAIMAVLILALSIALPSYAGGGRPSFSSRSSFSGGFRSSSSSSYRSFSSSPSRTFSFRSTPSRAMIYSRPPAAAPRRYTYSAPKATIATPVSRSTIKRTVINNHYHGSEGGSGGGGFSVGDALVLHALTSHNNSPTYVNTQPVVAGPAYSQQVVAPDYQDGPAVLYQREESHFWRNTFLIILGGACFYGLFRLFKYLAASV